MNKMFYGFALSLMLCLVFVPAAFAGACTEGMSGTTVFAAGFSCTIGDEVFSDFSYQGTGSNPVTTSELVVNAVGPTSDGFSAAYYSSSPGLQFNAPWDATAGETSDAAIGFQVNTNDGADLFTDFGLAQTAGVTAPGLAEVAETGCGPATCTPTGGPLDVMTFNAGGTSYSQSNETAFTGVTSVDVIKDITASGGTNGSGGFASISIVQDTFSETPTAVPEPASVSLLGFGLLAGFGLFKRLRSTQS